MKEQQSSNFNQALWLGISQFATFSLALVSAAILSRYFEKGEYGTYKQVMYVYLTLQVVFTASLPKVFSFFIPRLEIGQTKELVNKVTLMLAFLGAIFAVALYAGAGFIADILKNPELKTGLRLFAVVPFFTLPAMGIEGIYTALRKTKTVAIYQTISKLLTLVCVILPVIIWGGDYKTALIGWSVAHFLVFILTLYLKNKPFVNIASVNIPHLHRMVLSYTLPLMGASIVGMFLHSANQFFISRYYGEVTFAEFANGFITLPFIGMVAGSVKSVLLPLFSKANALGQIDDIVTVYNSAVQKSILIIYPVIFFVLFFAKDIVVLLYGEQYAISASYFRVSLCKDFFDIFPYLAVILAIGKSNAYFLIHLVFALLLWGINFCIVSLQLPPIYIAYSFSITYIVMIMTFIVYLKVEKKILLINGELVKFTSVIIIHITMALSVLKLIDYFFMENLTALSRLIACGILFYTIIVISGKRLNINYIESVYRLRIK